MLAGIEQALDRAERDDDHDDLDPFQRHRLECGDDRDRIPGRTRAARRSAALLAAEGVDLPSR